MVKKKSKLDFELDIFSYFLVPKMNLLTEAEKKGVLKKYSIVEKQLPKMKVTDPVAKKLNAQVGDVVKIERQDPPAKYNYYRLVV